MNKILLVGLGCLLASGCTKPAAPAAPPVPPPPDVEVVQVEQRDVPIYGEWVGTTDGFVNAAIKPQVSGYLLRRAYKEGSRVTPGEVMFELDPRPFQAAAAQAEGFLAQAEGQLAQANSQLAQARAAVSQAEHQTMQARAGQSQAEGQELQAQAVLAQAAAGKRKTELDVQRYRPLAEKKAVTQQDLDNAVQADHVARAQVAAGMAQIQTAKAGVVQAIAQIGSAQSTVSAAHAQIGTAMAAIQQARAQIKTASAQLQAARLNLEFTRVLSPIEGVAGISRAQVGDLLSPSGDPLTTVSTLDPIKVNFTMPEQEYLQGVERNPSWGGRQSHQRQTVFSLVQSDGSVYPRKGKFYAEDRNMAGNTGAIRITATFPNPGLALRPGQYARVRAVRYIEKKALLIPQRAVSELQDKNQVAVVGKDNKVDLRKVVLGERVGDQWIVKQGLEPGDTVIAEGVLKVGPGAPVHPQPWKSTPTPQGTPTASPTVVSGHE